MNPLYNNAHEHHENLRALFRRLNKKTLRCNMEKCIFAQPSVGYPGHILSTQDAIANRRENTEIFHGFSVILHKFPASTSVNNNGGIAQAHQNGPTMEMEQKGTGSL